MKTIIGTGQLGWHRAERVTDRYGTVALYVGSGDTACPLNEQPAGTHGTLGATVLATRQSPHIGDLFRGIGPTTPQVGEVIPLGTGTLFYEETSGTTYVGVTPDDGREADWLNPAMLYRSHAQTVELWFEPTEQDPPAQRPLSADEIEYERGRRLDALADHYDEEHYPA